MRNVSAVRDGVSRKICSARQLVEHYSGVHSSVLNPQQWCSDLDRRDEKQTKCKNFDGSLTVLFTSADAVTGTAQSARYACGGDGDVNWAKIVAKFEAEEQKSKSLSGLQSSLA